MTKLSVNINKFATLRNARGGDNPNVIKAAMDCERYGAQGITVHPRPDERHITKADAYALKEVVTTEYNIEGNPTPAFVDMVLEIKPTQVTLVPDEPAALTSDHGWDTHKHLAFLQEVIATFKSQGIRTSIFVDPVLSVIEGAKETGTDRIELYTEAYASLFNEGKEQAIKPYLEAAQLASKLGLGINAGHDLSLANLSYFKQTIPNLEEVSIGHALICDALYYGLENTVNMYLHQLG